MLPRT